MNRQRMAFALLPVILELASTTTFAASGFDNVVRLFETRYSVRHHGVPGLWLAKPSMFVSRMSGLKIAEFDSFHIPSDDGARLLSELKGALGDEWTPFVETWSKLDCEWSVIYARERGDRLELLIVDSDNDDGVTVLQLKVSGKAVDEWISERGESARHTSSQVQGDTKAMR